MRPFQWTAMATLGVALAMGWGGPAAADQPVAPLSAPAEVGTGPAPSATAEAAAWQAVISGQIEAFRRGDAATAFGYAGEAFRKTFPDPASFMLSIAASGYTPIFTSISHSFGKFRRADQTVVQEVEFMGAKQDLYEAIYVLRQEADGWRVQGVELTKTDGMGV